MGFHDTIIIMISIYEGKASQGLQGLNDLLWRYRYLDDSVGHFTKRNEAVRHTRGHCGRQKGTKKSAESIKLKNPMS